jgi:NAD kinase
MPTNSPRAVFVTRETEFELLIARHATKAQASFFLDARAQTLEIIERKHNHFLSILHSCRAAVPSDWRQALVRRADFDRFLFGPEDIVVAIGQDGLVANVAKYLDGQPVIGVNPDPSSYDGVLVRLSPEQFCEAIARGMSERISFESRAMVKAELDSGEILLALNEIFVGHRSHQSARYEIVSHDVNESHSSSGLIISSGTGITGWARSISEATGNAVAIEPSESKLCFFVREPFPSISTGTAINFGIIEGGEKLRLTSKMNEGGTIFADGIEKDRLAFEWGRIANIGLAETHLRLAFGF